MGFASFLARRLVTFVPTVLGVLLLTYLIAYAVPADPVRAWAGEKVRNPEALQQIREKYKFDAPWYEQFSFLLKQLLTMNLEDPVRSKNVFDELGYRFPVTVQLALVAFAFLVLISLPLGVIAALRKDTAVDFFVRFLALFGSSMPSFVLYYFMILLLFVRYHTTYMAGIPTYSTRCALWLDSLPSSYPILGHVLSYIGAVPMFGAAMCGEWDVVGYTLRRFYLPGLALALLGGGFVARIVRNSFLDALGSEHVLFAKARGLKKWRIWRHVFKNAMIPVVTVLGLQLGGLLSGAVIAEYVFNIPGLGRYMYESVLNLNYPAIIASTFVFALVYVVINLAVDILYALIDPRIRY
ncbi:MAG: ABC transporter permease [Fervidicoccaceae archaeon]